MHRLLHAQEDPESACWGSDHKVQHLRGGGMAFRLGGLNDMQSDNCWAPHPAVPRRSTCMPSSPALTLPYRAKQLSTTFLQTHSGGLPMDTGCKGKGRGVHVCQLSVDAWEHNTHQAPCAARRQSRKGRQILGHPYGSACGSAVGNPYGYGYGATPGGPCGSGYGPHRAAHLAQLTGPHRAVLTSACSVPGAARP